MSTDKLDLSSPDLVNDNFEKLAALFPNCVTESANGKAIDFDLLKQELSHQVIEGNKERYRLEWPGKRQAIVTANLPTTKTLRPVRENSVNFDSTENIYIEGDNLEVLKLLQESYLGKIKMIYIDPPYNTGKDFVYKDNFSQDSEEYKAESGQKDEYSQRLVTNPDTSGRYHSDWLSMMYPRLKLARNLLKDDGVIFISIDDNENTNLRKICNEVFGEENFIDTIIWKKRYGGGAKEKYLVALHEYVLVFSKRKESLENLFIPLSDDQIKRYYTNKDKNFIKRGGYRTHPLEAMKSFDKRENLNFPVTAPDGSSVWPKRQWRWAKETFLEAIEKDEVEFSKGKDGEWSLSSKQYLIEENGEVRKTKPFTLIDDIYTQHGTNEMVKIFGDAKIFDFPKPSGFLYRLIQIGFNYNKSDIFLDFFSGSATSAQALINLNLKDNGNRKFIQVQVPEVTDINSEPYKAGYSNICEIGKERIRRAGKAILEEQQILLQQKQAELKEITQGQQHLALEGDSKQETLKAEITDLEERIAKLDIGFRVYRLDSSNMEDVYYQPQDYKQNDLKLFEDNIKADRTPDDLLAQVMLDWGLPLSLPIEQATVAGKQLYKVAGDSLFACFDSGIDEAFAKAIASEAPLRIVFRDKGFSNDTAKTNVKQLLYQLSPTTEMKVI